jgi:hypothetical protein
MERRAWTARSKAFRPNSVAKWTELAGTRDYLVQISARGHQDYGIAAHANEESKCRRSIFHKASKLEYVV